MSKKKKSKMSGNASRDLLNFGWQILLSKISLMLGDRLQLTIKPF